MKILILAPLPPYHRGGIERVVGELAQRLSRDHDADVQCGQEPSVTPKPATGRAFTLERITRAGESAMRL